MTRSCEEDPAFDYLLMLFLETTAEPLTVLPTHRLVRGLGEDGLAAARRRDSSELFEVSVRRERPSSSGPSATAWRAAGPGGSGSGRADGGIDPHGPPRCLRSRTAGGGAPAVRGLDVSLLGVALERLVGIDARPSRAASGSPTRSRSSDAVDRVGRAEDGADAAFLLEPTPVPSIDDVAATGEVMPQKSTYFYPKALTGLVINPHEW